MTSHFLSGRHTHTQPWPVWHQREKPSYIIVVQAIDLQLDVVDLSESGSQGCCLLQFSFGPVFFSHYKHSRLLFFEGWSFIPTMFRDFDHNAKGSTSPKCSRELRSNALPKPFHDLLCHLLPKVWTSILPSHGRSLFQRCLPPLDAWGAPFAKWL